MSTLATNSMSPSEPIGIAVVGESLHATFHLESAALHPALRLVAAVRPVDPTAAGEAIPDCPFATLDDVLSNDCVSLVLVTGSPELVRTVGQQVLESGRHLAVDTLDGPSGETLSELSRHAESKDSLTSVWRTRGVDTSWLQALNVAQSEESGAIRSVRFLMHDLAASMLPGVDSARYPEKTHGVLATLGPDYVSDLLALVDGPVVSVFGTLNRSPLLFGSESQTDGNAVTSDHGFLAQFKFKNGVSAVLDIDFCSAAPVSTGWIVQCKRGGFADGQQSITVEDGEVYQVPVEVEPVDPIEELANTIQNWANTDVRAASRATLARQLRVATLIRLIRESHDSDQSIRCDV